METLDNYKLSLRKLKAARGERTMSEVAKILGVPRQYVYAYEEGKQRVPVDMFIKLCFLYQKPVEYFLD